MTLTSGTSSTSTDPVQPPADQGPYPVASAASQAAFSAAGPAQASSLPLAT